MNWFERYGIPGAYFIGLMTAWVFAFHPNLIKQLASPDPQWLGLAVITFLPIGYIISIASQVIYLNWRRCFPGSLLQGWLGFHSAAMDRLNILDSTLTQNERDKVINERNERDEVIIEARTLLLSASKHGPLNVEAHKYTRNWIARRMDVVAIDQSLIIATFVAPFFAVIIAVIIYALRLGRPSHFVVVFPLIISGIAILGFISFIVILVLILSILTLRRQVIEVISGIYRTYR